MLRNVVAMYAMTTLCRFTCENEKGGVGSANFLKASMFKLLVSTIPKSVYNLKVCSEQKK
jgi:hypothetical protein